MPSDYKSLSVEEQQSIFGAAVHQHAHNFEISSTLITVILFGKCLEAYSKKQTVDKLTDLASLKPNKACLFRQLTSIDNVSEFSLTGTGREVEPDLLIVGDIVRVDHGQIIPIDGSVLKGSGLVNESMLTGESKPIVKEVDSKVFSGTILTRG